MSVKILHTADIHLDSPFTAFSPAGAEKKREAIRKSFLALVETVKAESVQMLFISGDLFDTEFATRDTAFMLKNAFASIPDCKVFIAPGNHDPFTANSVYASTEFSSNVHVFKDRECITFEDLKVRVYGYGFTSPLCSESTVAGYNVPMDEYTNILVCHGDMSGALSTNGPVTKREIAESGFNYIALGHIHKGTEILKEGNTYYAYSGCLCGRSFDESGKKTAYIGTVGKDGVSLSPVCFAAMQYDCITVDASEAISRRSVLETVLSEVKELPESVSVRVILVGETDEEYMFAPNELDGQTACSVTLVDNTRPKLSFTGSERDNTLRGVFYKIMEARIAAVRPASEEYYTLVKALKYGLTALEDKSIADFGEDDK